MERDTNSSRNLRPEESTFFDRKWQALRRNWSLGNRRRNTRDGEAIEPVTLSKPQHDIQDGNPQGRQVYEGEHRTVENRWKLIQRRAINLERIHNAFHQIRQKEDIHGKVPVALNLRGVGPVELRFTSGYEGLEYWSIFGQILLQKVHEMVAFGYFNVRNYWSDPVEVSSYCYTEEQYRGNGIGTALLRSTIPAIEFMHTIYKDNLEGKTIVSYINDGLRLKDDLPHLIIKHMMQRHRHMIQVNPSLLEYRERLSTLNSNLMREVQTSHGFGADIARSMGYMPDGPPGRFKKTFEPHFFS